MPPPTLDKLEALDPLIDSLKPGHNELKRVYREYGCTARAFKGRLIRRLEERQIPAEVSVTYSRAGSTGEVWVKTWLPSAKELEVWFALDGDQPTP